MVNEYLQELLDSIGDSDTPWETRARASETIVEQFGGEATTDLIALLQSDVVDVRNASALALRGITDDVAVAPLFQAIACPDNLNNRATLVYALQTLDCRDYFLEVLLLVVSDKGDVGISAWDIFNEQAFLVDDEDMEKAKKIIGAASLNEQFRETVLDRLSDFEDQ